MKLWTAKHRTLDTFSAVRKATFYVETVQHKGELLATVVGVSNDGQQQQALAVFVDDTLGAHRFIADHIKATTKVRPAKFANAPHFAK